MTNETEYKQNPIVKVISTVIISVFIIVIIGFTLLMLGQITFMLPFQILLNLPMIIVSFAITGIILEVKNYYDHKEIMRNYVALHTLLTKREQKTKSTT